MSQLLRPLSVLVILAGTSALPAMGQFEVDPFRIGSESEAVYRVESEPVKARTIGPLTSMLYYHRTVEFDRERIVEQQSSCVLISNKELVEVDLQFQLLATGCPGMRQAACSAPSSLRQKRIAFWTIAEKDFADAAAIGASYSYHPNDSLLAEVPPGCCLALQVTAIPTSSKKIRTLGLSCSTDNDPFWWDIF